MEVLANTTVLMLQYIKVADQYIYTLNLYNVMYQLYQPINQSTINSRKQKQSKIWFNTLDWLLLSLSCLASED